MPVTNVQTIELNGKKILLLGTAHVSKNSVEEVKELIESEKPDTVCVELCKSRYDSMYDKDRWQKMDIVKIIKEKKTTIFLVNLILSSYQKKMAKQLGIKAGQEMTQGIESAREISAEVVLADRNIDVTFRRITGNLGLWDKMKLLTQLIYSMFSSETITEEDIERLKSEDMLDSALSELTKSMPKLKTPLVDERDKYLAQKIKEAPGEKIIAVIGAAHIPGIMKEIYNENDLNELSKLPKKKNTGKVIAWIIPIIIILLIVSTFLINRDAGEEQIVSWILWNGSFAALGAIIALAHPLSIITAFLIAPFSSLNPLVAAGWFAGLVEVLLRRPNVQDFENVTEDILTIKGFWKNKVIRVLLVVILVNIGSSVGTIISGTDIIRIFIENISS